VIRRRSGHPGPAQGRDPGAHERPGREGDPEEVRLHLADRSLSRESGENPCSCREWFECGGGGVEGRRRRLTDQGTPDGVPEVQEGDVLRRRGFGRARGEEEVVVVGVVVERSGGEGQEVRQGFPDGIGNAPVGSGGVLIADDPGGRRDDGGSVGRRPGDLLDVEFGMVETAECALDPPDKPADRFQQGLRPAPEGGERLAVEVAKEADVMRASAEVTPFQVRAGFARDGFRKAQRRIPLEGARDESVLQVEPLGALGGAADLEHEPAACPVVQQKVGVALARERSSVRLPSPQLARDRGCLVGGDSWPVSERVDGEREFPGLRHQRSRSRSSPSLPRYGG